MDDKKLTANKNDINYKKTRSFQQTKNNEAIVETLES